MSRVLLVAPPSWPPSGAPPLALLYLAGALQQRGHTVGGLDLGARLRPGGPRKLAEACAAFQPDVLGISLYTPTALAAYGLLGGLPGDAAPLRVAGGPHATACPEEALAHGFDLVVAGEGEETLVEFCDALDSGRAPTEVPGVVGRGPSGEIVRGPARRRVTTLDALPRPVDALEVFDRTAYVAAGGPGLPATLLSSRGCPGRCTFCSNQVTGRRYRLHSPQRVAAEMQAWHEREGATVFSFHDDALTARRSHTLALCKAIRELPFAAQWVCEARVDHLDAERARALAAAGCVAVVLGAESGSPSVLERSGKGITPQQTEAAIRVARKAGLRTQVNVMLGFPDETVAELDETRALLERIGPLVDGFSPGGVVIPYPGTDLYEQQRQELPHARWWLDAERMAALAAPGQLGPPRSVDEVLKLHEAIDEAPLRAGLVRYSDEVKAAIRRCTALRRDHTRRTLSGSGR